MAITTRTINSLHNMEQWMDEEYALTGTFPEGSYAKWELLKKEVDMELVSIYAFC